jgi:hypothetical protein
LLALATEEARLMLAEICGWFTEGFDTLALKEAKALLEELDGKGTIEPPAKSPRRGQGEKGKRASEAEVGARPAILADR